MTTPARATALILLMMVFAVSLAARGAAARLEKISDHYYCYRPDAAGLNTGALVTGDGVLLINPPGGLELPGVLEALKRITPGPVRWVVGTDYRIALGGGPAILAERGAAVIGSEALRPLLSSAHPALELPASSPAEPARLSIAFGRQMRLFPGGIEVRIFAVQHKARSAADVAVFIPSEKVLQLGDLYNAGSYPEIDETGGGGSAAGWIDGIRQVIESVPLLKPAIPAPKPAKPAPRTPSAKGLPAPEKTLEEEINVITGHGPRSNLMELKTLLEACQKLRAEIAKLAAAGVAREDLLSSTTLAAFRTYNGFDAYALQLFDSVAKK